jgi:hypothetical protein
VFIHQDARRVRIAGITTKPVAEWVTQQACNLSMELADQVSAPKFLIRDRAPDGADHALADRVGPGCPDRVL